jgi:hypothetical protein
MSARANWIFIICLGLAGWLLESSLLFIAATCWHARRTTDAAIRRELYPNIREIGR